MEEMREDINSIEMKEMAEGLSRSLSWCHNMLRSQEKMTSESAFRELIKLLYIKYFTENIPEEREEMKCFLKGDRQIYPDQRFEHLFDKVKKVFDKECLFDYADHILAKPATCGEIIHALSSFDFCLCTSSDGQGVRGVLSKGNARYWQYYYHSKTNIGVSC